MITTARKSTSKNPLKVIPPNFPIEKLLDQEQLEPYAVTAELLPHRILLKNGGLSNGRLAFLNPDFQLIPLAKPGFDLCSETTLAIHGYNICKACPMRLNPPKDQNAITVRCGGGHLVRSVAAIRVNSQVAGYVCGPAVPTDDFYQFNLGRVPQPLRDDLLQYRREIQAVDIAVTNAVVSRIARRLSRRYELERRLKILRHTRKRIMRSGTEIEVLEAGFSGLQSFFGEIDIAFYMLTERGVLQLIGAIGSNHLRQPKTLESGEGHVGRVIAKQDDLYAADLAHNLEGFVRVDSGPPQGSVYTIPLVWGPEERRAALQIAAPVPHRFAKPDRQSAWAIADIMALAGVRIALKYERRTHRIAEIRLGPWADCMIDAIAAPASTLVEILEAKQRLMQGLAEEARGGADSTTAAVQLYDPSAQLLRFAACSGRGWTDETKAIEYKMGETSTGMHTFETGEELLVPDMEDMEVQKRFRRVLNKTRAVYAIPLRLGGVVIGVLSVCWDHTLLPGSPAPHREKLVRLVSQFESVFEVLNSRESEIKLRLVSTLANLPTLNSSELRDFARETVLRTKDAFGVRGCSIFLVFPGQVSARLVATTGIMPAKPIWYEPGEGLTGWVLENRRCLRLKDTLNLEELHSIDPKPKGVRKWTGDEEYRDAEGKRRFLAAPLIGPDRVVGVIRLTIKENLRDFTSEEETLLMQIAREMAETVDAGWKETEAQATSAAKAAQIQHLHEIGLGFAEIPDVVVLLDKVLETAITESQMKSGVIRRLNDPQTGLRLRTFQGPPLEALPPILELNPLIWKSLKAEEPVYIRETGNSDLWKEMLKTVLAPHRRQYLQKIQTAIHIPIRLKDRVMGLILLESDTLVEVPERVLQFLGLLGGYTAVALDLAETRKRLKDALTAAKPFQQVGILLLPSVHEIRNHVQSLRAMVENMQEMMNDRVYLEKKIASMSTELSAVREICRQVENFTPEEKMETVHLDDLTSQAIEDFRPLSNGIEIRPQIHKSFTVRAHPALLRSAFFNIMRNAKEAMPQGGVLTVAMETVEGKPAVSFTDTGCGMSEIAVSHVRKLFRTTKGAGRGLGLTAVQGIMIQHDGELRIKSDLGKGSKFTLVFEGEEMHQ